MGLSPRVWAMIDHYKTLGLTPGASADAVKKAFRALAKKFHPDRNASRTQWANTQTKRLLEANRVLSNALLRRMYDQKYALLYKRQQSTYSAKRYQQVNTLAAQAERILADLLNGHAERAMETYEKLQRRKDGFELSDHLEVRDWVDCKFLIAEQYQERCEYEKALTLYEELYHCEDASDRKAYVVHEVRDRILRICCRDLAATARPATAAQYYMRALALDLPVGRRAFLHKKIAECHLAVGDYDSARRQLAIAFRIKPDLKGSAKICEKLNFTPKSP